MLLMFSAPKTVTSIFLFNIYFAEYDPTQPPKLNEKVLKDKRKKLKETYDRVIRMYVSETLSLMLEKIMAELLWCM